MSLDLDIAVHSVITDRLTVCVRELHGREDGWPVIFLHDELTSAPLFSHAMQAMPAARCEMRPEGMGRWGLAMASAGAST